MRLLVLLPELYLPYRANYNSRVEFEFDLLFIVVRSDPIFSFFEIAILKMAFRSRKYCLIQFKNFPLIITDIGFLCWVLVITKTVHKKGNPPPAAKQRITLYVVPS